MNPQRSIDRTARGSERHLTAIAISRGIGIGRVVFLHPDQQPLFHIKIDASEIESEIQRFRDTVSSSIEQLQQLAAAPHPDPEHPVSGIFGVHLLILEESSFTRRIEETILTERVNAEWALKSVSDEYLERQGSLTDDSFREKYLDIQDVSNRLLSALSGSPATAQLTYSGAVIAANELRPSAIMELMKVKPAAVITERGGWTSHTSILAREFRLPMVSGIKHLEQILRFGEPVIVDGANGAVILNPQSDTVERFRSLQNIRVSQPTNGIEPAAVLSTLDGTEIILRANVDIPDAYRMARHFGARGIGLFRSESLIFSPGAIPSEDEQTAAYIKIAEAGGGSVVRIRTFDMGAHRAGYEDVATEPNPALGLRGIRLSLVELGSFRTQVRAILRASDGRNIDIVLPMVSGVDEIIRSTDIINEERVTLEGSGIPIGSPLIGAMIEVPSAVLTIGEIARNVDLLCLGTNDLVQYLLAADRDNDSVADWYQTLHPAVLRAISDVLAAATDAGIPAAICGEMAGSAFYVPLLIGLGGRELSMNVNSIPQIRRLVAGITVERAEEIAESVQMLKTANEVETDLRNNYSKYWKNLFPTALLNSRHR